MLSNFKIGFAKKRLAIVKKKSLHREQNKYPRFGVILDSEREDLKERFLKLKEELRLRDSDFQIVVCKDEKTEDNIFQGLVFTRKDLKWNGKIRNGEIIDFTQKSMDVLISFAEHDNKLATLLVSVSNAELRVGRKEEPGFAGLFDMVISTEFDEIDVFLIELKKYLKILNKI